MNMASTRARRQKGTKLAICIIMMFRLVVCCLGIFVESREFEEFKKYKRIMGLEVRWLANSRIREFIDIGNQKET